MTMSSNCGRGSGDGEIPEERHDTVYRLEYVALLDLGPADLMGNLDIRHSASVGGNEMGLSGIWSGRRWRMGDKRGQRQSHDKSSKRRERRHAPNPLPQKDARVAKNGDATCLPKYGAQLPRPPEQTPRRPPPQPGSPLGSPVHVMVLVVGGGLDTRTLVTNKRARSIVSPHVYLLPMERVQCFRSSSQRTSRSRAYQRAAHPCSDSSCTTRSFVHDHIACTARSSSQSPVLLSNNGGNRFLPSSP